MKFERAAAAIAVILLAISWKSEAAPQFRGSRLYDQCLAAGHTVTACDAAMREVIAQREEVRREYVKSCSAEYYRQHPPVADADDPFAKIMAGARVAPKECLFP